MVSSSLDKSIKKALAKDTSAMSSSAVDVTTNPNPSDVSLPPDEKIEVLFPKCKPRMEYSMTSPMDESDLISITSPSSSSAFHSMAPISTSATILNSISSNNLSMQGSKILNKQTKLSPDHKKQQHTLAKLASVKHEQNENYVETNPFRIGSNNRYFYAQQNESLFNTNSASSMHHFHYQPASVSAYHPNYHFLEPDEVELNPYAMDVPPTTVSNPVNTIPSSIFKTTPPDTPPALQPVESPLGSSRNLWDLSPIKIKSSTPTRIKTQSPTPHYTRPHRGSYKKLLSSPVAIEEDLETGHYYYNNKKPYYQAPQTDSDSNEPATFNDVHEVEKFKPKSAYLNSKMKSSGNKMKHSESSDVIYAEVKKKDERKIVKSKSGSGIIGE